MTHEAQQIHVWLHSIQVDTDYLEIQLIENLKAADIMACVWRPSHTLDGQGILMVGAVNPDAHQFIQEAFRNGTRRLLVVFTGTGTPAPEQAWRLLEVGAADVVSWQTLPDPSAAIAARIKRWAKVDQVVESPLVKNNLVGESQVWKAVLRQIVEVASFTSEQSRAQARAPVLLIGETGTGKELAARLIHSLDPLRNQHELVVVDCTTIVPDLSGSELFGHERGAFTGAVTARDGALALADRGTLFLDEVGELPPALQVQLLRALQEHTFKRVGSDQWHKTDFRLVAATNRDLSVEEAQGRFRRDLFYRLSTWTFRLPSLRDRREDILPLVRAFMRQEYQGKDPPEVDQYVEEYLTRRAYPGNVRELKNLTARMLARYVGPGPLTLGDLPLDECSFQADNLSTSDGDGLVTGIRHALEQGVNLRELKDRVKDIAISLAVQDAPENSQRAATRLGVSKRTVELWKAEQKT